MLAGMGFARDIWREFFGSLGVLRTLVFVAAALENGARAHRSAVAYCGGGSTGTEGASEKGPPPRRSGKVRRGRGEAGLYRRTGAASFPADRDEGLRANRSSRYGFLGPATRRAPQRCVAPHPRGRRHQKRQRNPRTRERKHDVGGLRAPSR